MADIDELRVHGVSGTHPRNMLYSDPVLSGDPESPWTGVHTRPPVTDRAAAFHWGGVTSGSPATAMWLLLLPFALVNTAGWMAHPRAFRPIFVPAVRLAGLFLTGVFVIQGLTLTMDLPWHALNQPPRWLEWAASRPRLVTAGLAVISLGLFGLLTRVAARSHFEQTSTAWQRVWSPSLAAMVPDPSLRADVSLLATPPSDDTMWGRPATSERLARIHVAFGIGLIGLTMAAAGVGGLTDALSSVSGWAALALLALCCGTTVVANRCTGHGVIDRLVAVLPLTAVAVTAFAITTFLLSQSVPRAHLPGLHDLGFFCVVLLAVAVIATFLGGLSTRPAALITIGAVVGGGLGAGVAMAIERAAGLTGAIPDGLGWFAVASLYGFLLIGAALALTLFRHSTGKHPLQALRDAIPGLGLVFNVVFVAMVGVVTLVVAMRWPTVFDTDLPPIDSSRLAPGLSAGAIVLFLLVTLLVMGAFLRMGRALIALAVFGGAAALLGLMVLGVPETTVLGVPLDLGSLPAVAASVAVLWPASFILTSILGGLRSRDRRRGLGILWDLAGMWPRWYHPFAPPPYGPRVVADLTCEVGSRLDRDGLILAGHSQGSVLAAIVVSRLTPRRLSKLGFITYGSPLVALYVRFFPSHFTSAWIEGLVGSMRDGDDVRWRNLWRDSDPIGGPIPGVEQARPLQSSRKGHAGYEVETRYVTDRRLLETLVGPRDVTPP